MKIATLNNEVQFASEGSNVGGVPCAGVSIGMRIYVILK
jgi:hypothetical protein